MDMKTLHLSIIVIIGIVLIAVGLIIAIIGSGYGIGTCYGSAEGCKLAFDNTNAVRYPLIIIEIIIIIVGTVIVSKNPSGWRAKTNTTQP